MTFQQLAYLVETSKRGSINKAAQSLYVSQSAISFSISELEKELGIQIIERSNRGVTFTPEGNEFLGYANSLLEQKSWIEKMYTNERNDIRPVILSVVSQRFPFAEDAFLKFLDDADSKRFRYSFKEAELNALIDDIYDHRADLGVLFVSQAAAQMLKHLLMQRNLVFHKLAEVAPSVYIRTEHPLASHKEVTEEELLSYPYVAFNHKLGATSDILEEYQTGNIKKTKKIIQVSERIMSYRILSSTNAYTTGSGLLSPDNKAPLITRPIHGEPPIQIGWVSPADNDLSSQAQRYIELLQESLQRSLDYTEELRSK